MKILKYIVIATAFLSACNNGEQKADAYGNLEAKEILVSAETPGRVVKVYVEEGSECKAGDTALIVDTTQLILKRNEVLAKKKAVLSKKKMIEAQAQVSAEQLDVLLVEKKRVDNLLLEGAATKKQLDDILGKIGVLEKQVQAVKSNLQSIGAEGNAMDAAVAQIDDMINRSFVKIPSEGVVINQFVEEGELTAPGRPLFKLANLTDLEVKAYISGGQLSSVKIGQEVDVLVDGSNKNEKVYKGVLSWISPQAEFTPKNIQTKEERLSQVYAIKVKVKNDGALKINMPAEIRF